MPIEKKNNIELVVVENHWVKKCRLKVVWCNFLKEWKLCHETLRNAYLCKTSKSNLSQTYAESLYYYKSPLRACY